MRSGGGFAASARSLAVSRVSEHARDGLCVSCHRERDARNAAEGARRRLGRRNVGDEREVAFLEQPGRQRMPGSQPNRKGSPRRATSAEMIRVRASRRVISVRSKYVNARSEPSLLARRTAATLAEIGIFGEVHGHPFPNGEGASCRVVSQSRKRGGQIGRRLSLKSHER